MSFIKQTPRIYISYMDSGEDIRLGPFFSVSPDGRGDVIGQDWTAYKVVDENANWRRIIIPKKYHSITCYKG